MVEVFITLLLVVPVPCLYGLPAGVGFFFGENIESGTDSLTQL